MTFERALVVGAGQMGAGIAQVVAASGRQVLPHDPFPVLRRYVAAGRLGRKTGCGFYDYA
jgi:3-hydroxyacyl-CoA dehydrogenase